MPRLLAPYLDQRPDLCGWQRGELDPVDPLHRQHPAGGVLEGGAGDHHISGLELTLIKQLRRDE